MSDPNKPKEDEKTPEESPPEEIPITAMVARIMAGPNPTEEEAEFWDNWKDEMKERAWEDDE